MDLTKKFSFLVILACVLIALKNQRAALRSCFLLEEDPSAARRNLGGVEPERRLTYDLYGSSCPSAEEIVRTTVRELHWLNGSVGPALLRLAFHDCFVNVCDASVLVDSESRIESEKEALPNLSFKGFEEIDGMQSRVENKCPAIVSCADIPALAAREGRGQFYPVLTGRLDSKSAFPGLPGPDFVIALAFESFAAKGFTPREMVALLGGGHSTGKIHCNFFLHRLSNFNRTNRPDQSINAEFLEVLRSQCSHPASSPSQSPSPSPQMDYEGAGNGFGEVYYRSLMQGRGLLSGPAADSARRYQELGRSIFVGPSTVPERLRACYVQAYSYPTS